MCFPLRPPSPQIKAFTSLRPSSRHKEENATKGQCWGGLRVSTGGPGWGWGPPARIGVFSGQAEAASTWGGMSPHSPLKVLCLMPARAWGCACIHLRSHISQKASALSDSQRGSLRLFISAFISGRACISSLLLIEVGPSAEGLHFPEVSEKEVSVGS